MEDKNETCDTTLQLGLGVGKYAPFFVNEERKKKKKKKDEISNGDHHHNIGDLDSTSKTLINHHEFENYANNTRNFIHNKNGGVDHNSAGKKLKLSKEQSTMLEESFNIQNTPNLAQRQELADKLNLKPRQVEVWFQNRRARTKLKQRERDCEVLKKCCENLSGENKRLKKEVQELRSVLNFIHSSPFYIQASKSTMLTLCPFEVTNNASQNRG